MHRAGQAQRPIPSGAARWSAVRIVRCRQPPHLSAVPYLTDQRLYSQPPLSALRADISGRIRPRPRPTKIGTFRAGLGPDTIQRRLPQSAAKLWPWTARLTHPCGMDLALPPELREYVVGPRHHSDGALADLRSAVTKEPLRWWKLVLTVVSEADHAAISNSEVSEVTDACGPVVAQLLDLGGEWTQRVLEAADRDSRLASITAEAVDWHDASGRDVIEFFGLEAVVATWIRYQAEDSPWDFWACSLGQDIDEWPIDRAWQFIERAAESATSDQVLRMVGVTLIEDVLRERGEVEVDRLLAAATRSPRLRDAMPDVWWWHMIGPEAAGRIERETGAVLTWPNRPESGSE